VTEDKQKKTPTTSEESWHDVIVHDTTELVRIETWRDGENELIVQENLDKIKKFFQKKADEYREKYKIVPMSFFEWRTEPDNDSGQEYRVFGFRTGADISKIPKPRKVSLICHLDTVPPGNDNWHPFEAREETRIYNGVPTPFLIGRGAIDDKGPAVVAFEAFRRALQQIKEEDQEVIKKLKDKLILEVLFDTSEETAMSTPKYLEANKEQEPDLGIVFDAYWSVRAEKGLERPIFSISSKDFAPTPPENTWYIEDLKSPVGPANMIPVTAEALITGKKLKDDELNQFVANIYDLYRACPFDDVDYHPADIHIDPSNSDSVSCVKITAKVAGAQHGSAPQQNRANGANPIVSLTNFLAFLMDDGILADNHFGEMCKFIRWAFGTRPFGENHPELLYRFDPVYNEGNGTTYGLTQLFSKKSDLGDNIINLGIDVRYAIGHHSKKWDGKEGMIEGISLFKGVFKALASRYHALEGGQRLMSKLIPSSALTSAPRVTLICSRSTTPTVRSWAKTVPCGPPAE